jgi:hypothetical protein
MDERELKVKTTFERFIQVTLIRLKKLYDITFDEIPEVELVIKKYNVFDSKDTFEVYINTFNSEGSINEKFESVLRETCRFVQLHNEYTYQLFLNTIVPEMFDSLVSSAEKFKTEMKDYLSGYDSEDSKFEVEYVKPENSNWSRGENMSVRVIVTLYTKDPNDDKLRESAEKTLNRVLTRMITNTYSDFEGYSLYMDVEEMDNNINEIAQMSTELSENKVKNFFTKHNSSIKKTFLEELKNSSDDAKSAYLNFNKLISGNEPISEEEREKIGDELKGVFKRTLTKLGMAGIFLLPGGTIFLILMKLFKKKKSKVNDLPFDEINEGNKKIRVFSENTESDELKWHRDREDRLVTVLEGQGWEIQMDNELPKSLTKGQKYIIPEGVYHRIIKGQGNLKVSIEFI